MTQTYGPVVGYVTKKTTGVYAARNAIGEGLGTFGSVGEAKKALVQLSTGRALTWTREDLNGGIESYTATAGH